MKQFTITSDPFPAGHYIYFYPTRDPRVTTNPLRRIQGQLEEDAVKKKPGVVKHRKVFRALLGHVQAHRELYSEQELVAVRNNYLNYVAPPRRGHSGLALDEGEYRGLCESLAQFFLGEGAESARFSGESAEKPFHAFLTYYTDNIAPSTAAVLSPLARIRTAQHIMQIRDDGQEEKLLAFLAEKDPSKSLDAVYCAFRDVALSACAVCDSLAMVTEVPKS